MIEELISLAVLASASFAGGYLWGWHRGNKLAGGNPKMAQRI